MIEEFGVALLLLFRTRCLQRRQKIAPKTVPKSVLRLKSDITKDQTELRDINVITENNFRVANNDDDDLYSIFHFSTAKTYIFLQLSKF